MDSRVWGFTHFANINLNLDNFLVDGYRSGFIVSAFVAIRNWIERKTGASIVGLLPVFVSTVLLISTRCWYCISFCYECIIYVNLNTYLNANNYY